MNLFTDCRRLWSRLGQWRLVIRWGRIETEDWVSEGRGALRW